VFSSTQRNDNRRDDELLVSRTGATRANLRGFTLVELLVVIGVIAVLIAILMPALSMAREQSNRVRCANNLHQLCMSLLAYSGDHTGLVPPVSVVVKIPPNLDSPWVPYAWSIPSFVNPLVPYGLNINFIACPSTDLYNPPVLFASGVNSQDYVTNYCYLAGLYDPLVNTAPVGFGVGNASDYFDTNNSVPGMRPFIGPSTCILLTDLNLFWVSSPGVPSQLWSNHGGGQRFGPLSSVLPYMVGSNRCYVDGHVEWVTLGSMGVNNTKPTGNPTTAHYSHAADERPYYW
jgi:prepilin-type N-terminal cleavage/methylation domain-containing protein